MKCFKNYFGVLLCTLMMLPAVAMADNKLSFEPFSIKAGETKTLTIDMVNDKDITLVQFDLRLPEGLSVPTYLNEDEEEELDIRKTTRAHSSHMVSSNKNENVYRIMLASQTNKLFKQNEGAVVTVKIVAASTFKTGTITMEEIELVSPDETAVNPDPVSLEITLPKVTVTINNAERSYGQENPQFTYTASTNDNLTGLVTFSCEATKTSSVGEYVITGTSTATDLEVTFVNGKLTVTPAALTVTADAKSKEFGAADPELTYVATGLVNGDVLTGALTRAEGENAGTYAITQGTLAASSNYTLNFKGANLTITPKNIASPTIELAETSFSYDGTAKQPAVTSVKDGTTEIPASEYTVGYSNNRNAGTATVTVSGKTGGNYAINGSTTFVITKIPLTVKAVDTTREYGNDTPAFTVTYEGFVVGDTKDNSITTAPTITANATKTSPVGNNYVITVNGGAATNYELTGYTPATLTITKAPLTVTAKNVTRYVGQANPTLELTYSGFKNGETESVLTSKPVATTTATADSPVGEYVITVTGGEAQNYEITCVNGKLTVTEKPSITITAKSVTREYGIANPSLGFTVTGGAISGTPELTCEAVAGSSVGEYVIKVAKGSITTDANFTFTNGTLTITKAPLTVTAKDASREEGEANPTFELTYSGFRNGDTESVLTTKPVATTTATETSVAGTYAITVSGGEAQNYSFTYVAGTLTIVAKPDGIATVSAEQVRGTVYTLSGQRVEQPRKGSLYIVNGRKTVIK